MTPSVDEITKLLQAWRRGDSGALDKLIPLVYGELRRIARRYTAKQLRGHTLQTTDLINEAYIRLAGKSEIDWQNRSHFFGVCARIMRGIVIDHHRRRRQISQEPLDEVSLIASERTVNLLALDEALRRLEAFDARKSRIVEMRFFGGMTEEEVANILNLSLSTVKREWKRARGWLYLQLSEEESR